MTTVCSQIVSQSNIIDGDELEMTSRQKTFSIGLSREMVPMARLVVYYIREPEEIVSDVLTFFVNGTRQNQVLKFFQKIFFIFISSLREQRCFNRRITIIRICRLDLAKVIVCLVVIPKS